MTPAPRFGNTSPHMKVMRSLADHPIPKHKVFPPACLLDTAVTEARACKSHPVPSPGKRSAARWAGIYSGRPPEHCLCSCRIRSIPLSHHLAACVVQRGEGEGGIWVTSANSFAWKEKGLLDLSSGMGGGTMDADERVVWWLLEVCGTASLHKGWNHMCNRSAEVRGQIISNFAVRSSNQVLLK